MSFETKFRAGDDFVSAVRVKHGIAEEASFQDMEQKLMKLLSGDLADIEDAITLGMNRRIDGKDEEAMELAMLKTSLLSTNDKFAFLMIAASFIN